MTLSRRQFTRATLFGGLAASAAASAAVLLRFLWPEDAIPPPSARISKSDLPKVDAAPFAFEIGGSKGYLVSVSGAAPPFVALLRKCPLDCTVAWRPDGFSAGSQTFDAVFRCPCCGSVFDRYGAFVFGPAGRDLSRLVVAQEDDGDVRVSFEPSVLAAAP